MKRWTQEQVDEWNKAHPIGTQCDVRVSKYDPWTPTKTRSEAWLLGHGEPGVKVEGKAGAYGLDFLRFGGAK